MEIDKLTLKCIWNVKNLEIVKNKAEGLKPDFKTYYKARVIKTVALT